MSELKVSLTLRLERKQIHVGVTVRGVSTQSRRARDEHVAREHAGWCFFTREVVRPEESLRSAAKLEKHEESVKF